MTTKELGLIQSTNTDGRNEESDCQMNSSASIPIDFLYDPATPPMFAGTPHLVEHDKLLQNLKQRLCSSQHPVCIALHGLPGVGKTTLSAALVHNREIQTRFQGGVLWARVGPAPGILSLLSRWGTLLGISAAQMESLTTYEAWTEAIRNAIHTRHILLIIDDAWSIEDALAFKVGGPNCSYLVTTRFQSIALQFASRESILLPELNLCDGLTLLSHFVPDLVSSELFAAQELVQSVGGLPLALTLMGKYLQRQTYNGQPRRVKAALERLYNAEERLLLAEPQTSLERSLSLPADTPLSLQAVIEASERQLDLQARKALYALSIFPAKPNSFSEDIALTVCSMAVETLDILTDTGLLESSGPGRYTLHQTIVDYARAKQQDKSIEKRLVAHIANYIQQHKRNYALLELESTNIFVALELADKTGMFAELVQISCAFAPFLSIRGLYVQAEEQLTRAYKAAMALGDHKGTLQTLYHLGDLIRKHGNYVQAETFLKEGLTLAQQLGYTEQVSRFLGGLAVVIELQGNYTQAEVYYLQGLALARQLQAHEQVSHLLADLGVLAGQQGNYTQAETYLKEALALDSQIGLRERTSAILTALGWVTSEQGNYEQAEAYLKEGLILAQQVDSRERIGGLLWALGGAAIDQGHYTQATTYLKEGLDVARQLTHFELLSELLLKLSVVATDQGDYRQAELYLLEGLELARQLGHNRLISDLLQNLGVIAMKRGNTIQTNEYLQEGLALARQIGHRELICAYLSSLSESAITQEQNSLAEEYLQEGITVARQLGHRRHISILLSNLSMQAIKNRNYSQAEVYLREGLLLARQLGIPVLVCNTLYNQAEYHLSLQQPQATATVLREMLALIPEGYQELTANAQYGLARIAAMQNNLYEAKQLGQTSLAIFEQIGHYRSNEIRYWIQTLNMQRSMQ